MIISIGGFLVNLIGIFVFQHGGSGELFNISAHPLVVRTVYYGRSLMLKVWSKVQNANIISLLSCFVVPCGGLVISVHE